MPKAQIVADAFAQLGRSRSAAVAMVGDRHHDVEGGRANGCSIGVTWGFGPDGELEAAGADHVVDTARRAEPTCSARSPSGRDRQPLVAGPPKAPISPRQRASRGRRRRW